MNENDQSLLCPSYSERYTLNVSKENLCKVGLGRNLLSVAEAFLALHAKNILLEIPMG